MTENDKKATRWWTAVIAAVTAIMLSPALFCGFEVCDSGFYMTFYDNIFSHPESVSYNFMYYLSGIVGGTVRLVTGDSLIGMRVAGMLASIGIALCVCNATRGKDMRLPQLAATITVCAGMLISPLTFYNDILTMLMATASVMLLMREGHKATFWAALIAGLNTFTRIPNILEFLFIFLIVYRFKDDRKQVLKLSCIWCLGWLSGIATGLGITAMFGHIGCLYDTFNDLFRAAKGGADASTHSMVNLIGALIGSWIKIAILATGISLAGFITVYARCSGIRKWIKRVIAVVAVILCGCLFIGSDPVTSLGAFSVAGCVCNLLTQCSLRIKQLSAAGLLMIIILPTGSDNGIYNSGTIVLWLAAVPAFACVLRHMGRHITVGLTFVLASTSIITICRTGFYFDDTPLFGISAEVDLPAAGNIYTSPARAQRIERIVTKLSRYVESGDTLLVYGSAPMLNHLTGTLPAIGCSWPELLTATQLKEKLDKSGNIPNIVVMRFNTIGSEWGEPSDLYVKGLDKTAGIYHNAEKSSVIEEYIRHNGCYKCVEDEDFIFYTK